MRALKIVSFLVLISCILLICYTVISSDEPSKLYTNFLLIDQNVDTENIADDESIFFIETRSGIDHAIDSHQACSVESAAIMYPNRNIYLMFVTKTNEVHLDKSSLVEAISSYGNIHFKYLNIHEFSKNTPLDTWMQTNKLINSNYEVSHTSDALRFLTLWKFGGTYLDLDVIVKKATDLKNFACAEGERFMNGAVLNLDRKRGKEISSLFIEDFVNNFDGKLWGNNGPEVITRVLKKLCNFPSSKSDDCQKFNILRPEECYAIGYDEWKMFFEESSRDEVHLRTKDSHFIHLWNKFSSNYRIKVTSNNAYLDLARKLCPKVYKSRETYF